MRSPTTHWAFSWHWKMDILWPEYNLCDSWLWYYEILIFNKKNYMKIENMFAFDFLFNSGSEPTVPSLRVSTGPTILSNWKPNAFWLHLKHHLFTVCVVRNGLLGLVSKFMYIWCPTKSLTEFSVRLHKTSYELCLQMKWVINFGQIIDWLIGKETKLRVKLWNVTKLENYHNYHKYQ